MVIALGVAGLWVVGTVSLSMNWVVRPKGMVLLRSLGVCLCFGAGFAAMGAVLPRRSAPSLTHVLLPGLLWVCFWLIGGEGPRRGALAAAVAAAALIIPPLVICHQ